jgi:hypothetical protein
MKSNGRVFKERGDYSSGDVAILVINNSERTKRYQTVVDELARNALRQTRHVQ